MTTNLCLVIKLLTMKKREIVFSIMFLILSYYIIRNRDFISFKNSSDLLYYILFIIGALILAITSIIDLRHWAGKDLTAKISLLFCMISSLIFVLVAVFSVIKFEY